jgi:hypothetical protein
MPTRDQVFLRSFGTPPPTIRPDAGTQSMGRSNGTNPNIDASGSGLFANIRTYMGMNPQIAKGYVINPTDQGQRAAMSQRASMMYDPRNSPSRSQFSEGYTAPIQRFAVSNTWNTPSGLSGKADRARQPSTKLVSPYSSLPIPTRMPWDL